MTILNRSTVANLKACLVNISQPCDRHLWGLPLSSQLASRIQTLAIVDLDTEVLTDDLLCKELLSCVGDAFALSDLVASIERLLEGGCLSREF